MAERQQLWISSELSRQKARRWVDRVPLGWTLVFQPPRRSTQQNAKLHAMLSEVSRQVVWYGVKLSVEDWKRIFAASLQKVRVVPGIDAGTFVPVGLRTREMSPEEMNDMIELVFAFGAERGVVFRAAEYERAA